uniref:Uncharacterized protein n=1 Tax=Naja naja TaxID=35670 RepID=A0A8C6XSG7_NAJNA
MKCIGPSESQNLALVLEYALAREAKIWKAPVFQNFTLKVWVGFYQFAPIF